MTSYLFSEDQSAALLLLDQILTKGFDGQYCISGLASHFRNLLMAQNQPTVQLMPVSESVKQKFLQQAKILNPSLLLRALTIANDCDFNYKSSNNKRLSIEVALLQINANYRYMQSKAVRQSREQSTR